MEFEPIVKFELQPIEPQNFRRAFTTAEFVTVRENDVYLNDKLYARMNFPDHLVVAMDSKMRVLGLKPTVAEDKFGYKVKMQTTGGARIASCRLVIDKIQELMKGLDFSKDNIRLVSGKKSGEYFVFDLDKHEKVSKRAIKKD